jgi:hypothetical protein
MVDMLWPNSYQTHSSQVKHSHGLDIVGKVWQYVLRSAKPFAVDAANPNA